MKYSKEKIEELCNYLKSGNNRTDSCVLSDISYETFTVWMQKPEFSEGVKKAEASCKALHIQNVRRAAFGDGKKPPIWTASAWWLERKHQDEFAIKYKLEHAGKLSPLHVFVGELRSKLKGMTPQQLRKLAEGK
jgi:hypothetical protein